MRLRIREDVELDPCASGESPATQDDVRVRVRRFAQLRAAQRALTPSRAEPLGDADRDALRGIREKLAHLTERFAVPNAVGYDEPIHHELQQLDGALDGYAHLVRSQVEKIPLSQLRASLSEQEGEQRTEVMALLEVCLEPEDTPKRFLRVIDFLITLLCASRHDGTWLLQVDPANLNDTIRQRSWESGHCETQLETRIVGQFQRASERLTVETDGGAVLEEISRYKLEIAPFFFVPAVLRCIVAYNVVARNHFDDRLRRHREADAAIDDQLNLFASAAEETGEKRKADSILPAHEAPGILAVQDAIRLRLLGTENSAGPANRIASTLDLEWLEKDESEAFLQPDVDGVQRVIRMTVVLGHLAMVMDDHPVEFQALGLHAIQLDTWIFALGDDVQSEIDTLIRGNEYDGAVRLGDTKSRFLAAVLVVARRRSELKRARAAGEEGDDFARNAIDILREHLERGRLNKAPPMFIDLFGGGWRRTVALCSIGLLVLGVGVVQLMPSGEPRAVREVETWKARDISRLLVGAYRDHADKSSMLVGTVSTAWAELDPKTRRDEADVIRVRVEARGVEEMLLFDEDRVLQAHSVRGEWRSPSEWR